MSLHPPVVWLPGVGWDGAIGTDRRLATALAPVREVLWVEPPVSVLRRPGATGESGVAGVIRRRVRTAPGMTRPVSRTLARIRTSQAARALASQKGPVEAVILAHPLARFPRGLDAARILYITDDWVAGAGMMGFDQAAVVRNLRAVLAEADVVIAVTDTLLDLLHALSDGDLGDLPLITLPNGGPEPAALGGPQREPVAGLIGQLNERLDLDALEAVVSRGVPLRVIGRRVDTDPEFGTRLDVLLTAPGVEWLGVLAPEQLPDELARLGAGLTPYADSAFNRASSPLKTLEYLASGLPVVSTGLPASRWLDSPDVRIASTPALFGDAVSEAIRSDGPDGEVRRRAFAAEHTWAVRAAALDDVISARAIRRSR